MGHRQGLAPQGHQGFGAFQAPVAARYSHRHRRLRHPGHPDAAAHPRGRCRHQRGHDGNWQKKSEDIGDLVYITNNSIGKQILAIDSLGQTSIQIQPSEKNRPIERDYVRQAMQLIQMRRLFEYGILQFEDKSFYRIYGIERKFDMSEENVLDMFSVEKISTTASKLKELFKKEDTGALQHELCYKALDLVQKGKLPMEETNTINVTLNKIFCSGVNVSFNDLLSNLSIKRGEI